MSGDGKPFRFRGFQSPKYTQVPDELFDELLPLLSGAELKVLLYVIRRTFGFKRDADTISLTQICQGIVRHNGEHLDGGTGLHRETAVLALKRLEALGAIEIIRRSSAEKGNETSLYALRMAERTEVPWSENPTSPSRVIRPAPVGKSDPQETVVRETVLQETENSKFRKVTTQVFDSDRQTIGDYVGDIALELADQASLKASTTRALNLFRRSGLELAQFTAAMLEARGIAKERSASIRSSTKDPDRLFPTKRKMGYWFAVLEDRLGMREVTNNE
ncbi:MAG TPA: replication protein [Chloroflexota bacterium]|nr:replication protein [Chloroflexota bacterium]